MYSPRSTSDYARLTRFDHRRRDEGASSLKAQRSASDPHLYSLGLIGRSEVERAFDSRTYCENKSDYDIKCMKISKSDICNSFDYRRLYIVDRT